MRRVVEANLARGVDWVKVNATERAGTPDTDPRKQMFTEEELRVIVETAAKRNVPVQAHAHGAEGALAAVKAGVRSIEHGTYLTDETLQLMAKQGTYFDPTMEAMKDVATSAATTIIAICSCAAVTCSRACAIRSPARTSWASGSSPARTPRTGRRVSVDCPSK